MGFQCFVIKFYLHFTQCFWNLGLIFGECMYIGPCHTKLKSLTSSVSHSWKVMVALWEQKMSTLLLQSVSYWLTSKHEDQWAWCMITKGWDSHSAERQASQSRPSLINTFGAVPKANVTTISLNVDVAGELLPGGAASAAFYFEFKAKERLFVTLKIICLFLWFVFLCWNIILKHSCSIKQLDSLIKIF